MVDWECCSWTHQRGRTSLVARDRTAILGVGNVCAPRHTQTRRCIVRLLHPARIGRRSFCNQQACMSEGSCSLISLSQPVGSGSLRHIPPHGDRAVGPAPLHFLFITDPWCFAGTELAARTCSAPPLAGHASVRTQQHLQGCISALEGVWGVPTYADSNYASAPCLLAGYHKVS